MAHLRLLLLVAVLVCSGATGCSREGIELPPPDATPEEVVRAYIDAVNARDCRSLKALSVPAVSTRVQCGDDVTLTNIRIGEAREDGCCGMSESFAQSRNVPVVFDRRGVGMGTADQSDVAWAYILVRDDDDQPWRVVDQGVG